MIVDSCWTTFLCLLLGFSVKHLWKWQISSSSGKFCIDTDFCANCMDPNHGSLGMGSETRLLSGDLFPMGPATAPRNAIYTMIEEVWLRWYRCPAGAWAWSQCAPHRFGPSCRCQPWVPRPNQRLKAVSVQFHHPELWGPGNRRYVHGGGRSF